MIAAVVLAAGESASFRAAFPEASFTLPQLRGRGDGEGARPRRPPEDELAGRDPGTERGTRARSSAALTHRPRSSNSLPSAAATSVRRTSTVARACAAALAAANLLLSASVRSSEVATPAR
jgi:hypothetical protein